MPRPPNKHECVCGHTTPYWANMVGHRRTCDSWKEHKRLLEQGGIGNSNPSVPPDEQKQAQLVHWECPHEGCNHSGDSPDGLGLVRHLKWCGERIKADQAAEQLDSGRLQWEAEFDAGVLLYAADRRREKFEAYEAWCRANGREP